jgi:hypothetical protein
MLGTVVHTCDPSNQEAKAGGHSETLSQNMNKQMHLIIYNSSKY